MGLWWACRQIYMLMRTHHKLAHSQLGTLILCSSLLQWSELAMTRASTISSHFLSLTFLFGVLLCTKAADLANALCSFVVYCDCMINVLRLPDQLDLQLAIMRQIGPLSTGVFSDTCQPLGSFYFRLALPMHSGWKGTLWRGWKSLKYSCNMTAFKTMRWQWLHFAIVPNCAQLTYLPLLSAVIANVFGSDVIEAILFVEAFAAKDKLLWSGRHVFTLFSCWLP